MIRNLRRTPYFLLPLATALGLWAAVAHESTASDGRAKGGATQSAVRPVRFVVVRRGETAIRAGDIATMTVPCRIGEQATGGGFEVLPRGAVNLFASAPAQRESPRFTARQGVRPTAWLVSLQNPVPNGDVRLRAFVICALR